MVDRLLNLALVGGDPILYLLIALSALSVAVIIERLVAYIRNRIDLPTFSARIVRKLNEGDIAGAAQEAKTLRAAEARVVVEGLENFDKGAKVAAELMESTGMREQQRLDRRLGILGTIGSNAPFVGLLGTVLGIIKALEYILVWFGVESRPP